MMKTFARAAAFAALLLTQATFAAAAEIKVYSTVGVKSALEELAPKFEQATGNKLNISWGLMSSYTKKAQDGDVPDVLIVSRGGIDEWPPVPCTVSSTLANPFSAIPMRPTGRDVPGITPRTIALPSSIATTG